ncbi:MAG: FtsX-like permease family protein, partial [Thermoproteota archaeon]
MEQAKRYGGWWLSGWIWYSCRFYDSFIFCAKFWLGVALVRKMNSKFFILIFAVFILAGSFLYPITSSQSSLGDEITYALNFLNLSKIENYVRTFSSFNSRVVGYPGYYKAKDYIIKTLRDFGYNVTTYPFKTVSPIDKTTFIELDNGTKLKAYSLWPNGLIQTSSTPSEGYSGKLVYVGKGNLEDFNGKEIYGSIVLMDYDSGSNWLNVAKLGAKAVIFIETNEYDRYEALKKFSMTPIKFTRLFVNASIGSLLRSIALKNETVKVVSQVSLDEVTGYNIVAKIDGTKYKDQVVAISARYDSWSIVPSLSPAAGEAISVSTLLEIARYFSVHRPERSIWIVAFSGHWNALDGPRQFAENVLFSPQIQNGTYKIFSFIGIDIGPESPTISTLYAGFGLRFIVGQVASNFATVENRFTANSYLLLKDSSGESVLSSLNNLTGLKNATVSTYISWDIQSNDWWGNQRYPYMLDTEPLALVNLLAFTIKTSNQHDFWWGNPQNDYKKINFNNVYAQALTILAHVVGLSNDESWSVDWQARKPTKFTVLYGYMVGLTTLTGEVVKLNLTRGWYSPVPRALVRIYPEGPTQTSGWPFSYLLIYADEKGRFNVTIGPIYSTPAWRFDAWVIDNKTNEIVAAPDMGPLYGSQVTKPSVSPVYGHDHVLIPLFDCFPVTLFDVYDPSYYRTPWYLDPRMPFSLWLQDNFKVSLLDFKSEAIPYFFGVYYLPWEPVAMFFVQPNSRVSFHFYFGTLDRPSISLINSSATYKEGYGILVNRPLTFNLTILSYTKDLISIVEDRYSKFNTFNIRSPSLDEALSKAKALFIKAQNELKEKNYSKAYDSLRQSLAYISSAYKQDLMPMYSDAGFTSVLLFLISIPSVVLMERLFFHKEGKERFIYTTSIGVVVFSTFFMIHPAFSVITNSLMGLIGVLLVFLFLITLLVLIMETGWIIELTSEKLLGKHRIGREEFSVLQVSVPTSLEFMRRRKFRSTLTAITLIAVVVALTSLTSSSYYTSVNYFAYGKSKTSFAEPKALVQIGYGTPPFSLLQKDTVSFVKSVIGNYGYVEPRAWYYPTYSNRLGHNFAVSSKSGNIIQLVAILGLSNHEILKVADKLNVPLNNSILYNAFCILTSRQAKSLNVEVGDKVNMLGIQLVVAGILPSDQLQNLTDITNLYPTPVDPTGSTFLAIQIPGQPTMNPPPLSWENVVILPFDLVTKLGGYVGSISITFNTSEQEANNLIRDLSFQSSLTPYYLENLKSREVVQAYKTKTYLLLGMEVLPLLIVIAALNVTTAILGSVKERMREIYIFTSVGLSPRGSAIMFVTESVTFALLASVIGYVVGFIMNRFLISLGLLPRDFVINAAS